uniref:(northern house mosquito) hypothetical protein n=1 Tax=Culex pipiens TaxID=7175 RepID=A0A8D8E0E2_CULPI
MTTGKQKPAKIHPPDVTPSCLQRTNELKTHSSLPSSLFTLFTLTKPPRPLSLYSPLVDPKLIIHKTWTDTEPCSFEKLLFAVSILLNTTRKALHFFKLHNPGIEFPHLIRRFSISL